MLGFDNAQDVEESDQDSAELNGGGEFSPGADMQPPAGWRFGRSVRFIKGVAARQLAAMITVGFAYLLRESLVRRHGGYPPFITFYPAVLLVAVLGDIWTVILTTVLSGLVVAFWVFPESGYFSIRNPVETTSFAIFCFSGIMISLIAEISQRSRVRLAAYRLDEAVRRERAKAEEAIRVSEVTRAERQRLFDVLDTLPAIISLLTPDRRVIFSNRGFRERFGESNGKRCYEAHFGLNKACDSCETYEVLKTGQIRHWEHHSPDGQITGAYDCPFTDVDGSPLVLSMNFDITEKIRAETELKEYRERLEALVKERTAQLEASNAQLLADIAEREKAEQALRDSEERWALLVETAPVGIVIHAADARITSINTEAEELLALPGALGKRLTDFAWQVFREDGSVLPMEELPVARVLTHKKAVKNFVCRIQRTSREDSVWLVVNAMPRFCSEGSLAEVFVAFMDITSLKRAEEQLHYQAELLEKVSDAVISTNMELRISSWNSAAERIYGWKAEEVLGKALDELLQTEFINISQKDAWETITIKGSVELELINHDRYGSKLFVQAHAVLLTDDQGIATGTIGIIRDITGPKRAAEALRMSEERLALFVEHAPASLAMFDTQMRYLHVSRRWRTDYGLEDRDLAGVSHYDEFPDIPMAWKESHRRGLSGEFSSSEADRLERADGSLQWIRWEVRPWYAARGEVGGILIFTENITAEKKAEESLHLQSEQLRALAARLQRVRDEERATVARDLHDQLGQVLTAIKMDVAWVVKRLPEAHAVVRDRLAGTIRLISDGAQSVRRICTGLRPGLLDDLGLAAAIEWQANEFSSRTGVCCNVTLPSEDLELNTDSVTAIFRVFQEALTNVARHAEAHQVDVFLGKQEDSIVIIVEDDGNGFCESETTNSLGLLGMRERAQACGGDVTISSAPGNGTTVTMYTPLRNCVQPRRSDNAHSDC